MTTHEEIQTLLPGYALDALDPEEAAAVQDHLRTCARCRKALAAYVRAADELALSVPEAAPPAALEERLMRAARALRPSVRPPAWLVRNRGLAAAAVVLIMVLAAGNIMQWVRSPSFQARSRGLVTIPLVGTGGNREAYGTIVVDLADSEGVLAVRGLHQLAPTLRYQLWLARDNETMSGGTFAASDDGYGSLLIKVPGGFRGFRSFSISVEPVPGSSSPTSAPILSGSL